MNKKNTGKLGLLMIVVTMMGVSQASHGNIKCVGIYEVAKASSRNFFGGSENSNKIVTVKSGEHESLLDACSDVLEDVPKSKGSSRGFFGGSSDQEVYFLSLTCENLNSHQTYRMDETCGVL